MTSARCTTLSSTCATDTYLEWTDWKGTAKSMAEFVRHPRPLRVYETRVEGGYRPRRTAEGTAVHKLGETEHSWTTC